MTAGLGTQAGGGGNIVAGIDIGNSTTEVVVARADGSAVTPLAWDRSVTRGRKGSPDSLDGAAALVRRVTARAGVELGGVAVAQLRPVRTEVASVPRSRIDTGRLQWIADVASTPGGSGVAVGRPVPIEEAERHGQDPVVVLVAGRDYAWTAARLRGLIETGSALVGVLLDTDEAVLVSNRLPVGLPIIDNLELGRLAGSDMVAIEVAQEGKAVQHLNDPLFLISRLGLAESETGDAARVAAMVEGRSRAVIASGPGRWYSEQSRSRTVADIRQIEFGTGELLALVDAIGRIRTGVPGGIRAIHRGDGVQGVDDLFVLDLEELIRQVSAIIGDEPHPYAIALLDKAISTEDPASELSARLGVGVRTAGSEALASWRGAATTPGAAGNGLVIDIGGGTIDAIGPDTDGQLRFAVTGAGAGELLTTAVASTLGIVRGAAEWVKRGPSSRVDRPQVLLGEDGRRTFLDTPAAAGLIGQLVVSGPAGLLPFSAVLSPSEWRLIRQNIKRDVLGANLARCLASLRCQPRSVVVVGGPAGDDELLPSISAAFEAGTPVGRGNVAGVLGHRYSVAYGLALSAAGQE
ncbi:MAG: hypothetical protein QOE71_589 [Pseudonocardiales bacterium]|nr:hypothetical protein [Pseudonocardiales bacterium]